MREREQGEDMLLNNKQNYSFIILYIFKDIFDKNMCIFLIRNVQLEIKNERRRIYLSPMRHCKSAKSLIPVMCAVLSIVKLLNRRMHIMC